MAVDLTQTIGQSVQTAQQYQTSALEGKIKNKDFENASDEELMEAVKSFESYFVEQVFKEVEKTIHTDDEDTYASQMVDYFKDHVIQTLSEKVVDQSGSSISQKLFEQMKRNYHIPEAPVEATSDPVSEKEAAAKEAAASIRTAESEPEGTGIDGRIIDGEDVSVTMVETNNMI